MKKLNEQERSEKNPLGAGAPRIKINWEEFDKLCYLQCTQKEIAAWFECDINTIEDAVQREKNVKYSDYYTQKRGKGKTSLRRAQWMKAVEDRDGAMLRWLGIQYLEQRDKADVDVSTSEPLEININMRTISKNED